MSDRDRERLDELTARLEQAATRLRTGELDPVEAAGVVEDCARIAAEAGAELDRLARSEDRADAGQLRLPEEAGEQPT